MSECRGTPTMPAVSVRRCPRCQSGATPVELQTVKALLTGSALARLNVTQHRFCPAPGCPVVYFDDAGAEFGQTDIRVPVSQKQQEGTRILCYCFGESEQSIRLEFEAHGRSEAVNRVRAHIGAQRCACDIRNPKGTCCLGDLTEAVRRIEAALAASTIQP